MAFAMRRLLDFWNKYENANLKIAFGLMSLQVIHLYWLTTDVVIPRISGQGVWFHLPQNFLILYVIIDYIEIPALVAGSAYYALRIYQAKKPKDALFLILLIVQVFHIFWITDEIVYDAFFDSEALKIPVYAAWVAILIDYLELPVMGDLLYRIAKGEK